MKLDMTKERSTWLILIIVLVAIGSGTVFWAISDLPALDRILFGSGIGGGSRGELQLVYFTVKSVITSLNATILIFLFITYLGIYRETKMKFSLGLMVFSLSWLIHVLIANPMIFHRAGRVIGLPIIFEQFFSLIALATLLYITYKY